MEIISEPYLDYQVSESMTLDVLGKHSPTSFDGGEIEFTLNTDNGDEGEPDIESVNFTLPTDSAVGLALNILDLANEVKRNQTTLYSQLLAFKNATSDCARGRIGTMVLSLSDKESPRINDGFFLLDIDYLDDVEGDGDVVHELRYFETHIPPFDQANQIEWLRGMVGGNHEFASQIAIKFNDWSFSQIDEIWAERLNVEIVGDGTVVPSGE